MSGAARFVSGEISDGNLVLTRQDGSTAGIAFFAVQAVNLTNNNDSTYILTFDGS